MVDLKPAAQYIRMSTEHQRYSPLSQAAAIRRYADEHGFEIVADYQDHGKSGVSLKGRDGLKRLLADILGGGATYQAVLVLDVSRWGRFQDPDQAAHYEFLCREAGVQIRYCSEGFPNDGSPTSALIKSFKRVMAGEYSRELGIKTLAGAITGTRLGYKQGGSAPYGLRRMLVDGGGRHVAILGFGEHRLRAGDRVVYVPGPVAEIEVIREVFSLYVVKEMTIPQIERNLRGRGVLDDANRRFTRHRLIGILYQQLYAGRYTYNKTTQRLQSSAIANDPRLWVTCAMLDPIVSPSLFAKAQARLKSRAQAYLKRTTRRDYTRDELIMHLRRVLAQHGRINYDLINATPGPSTGPFYGHFGNLPNAYEQIGYTNFIARRRREVYSPEFLIDGLKRLLGEHGYLCAEMIDDDPVLPGRTVYQKRFGTLAAAYRAAGWDVDAKRLNVLGMNRRLKVLREMQSARMATRGEAAPG